MHVIKLNGYNATTENGEKQMNIMRHFIETLASPVQKMI